MKAKAIKKTPKRATPKKKPATKTPKKRGRPAKKNKATLDKLKTRMSTKAAGTRPKKAKKKPAKKRSRYEVHNVGCHVCKSPYRAEIEERFKAWAPVKEIAEDYPGVSNTGLTRHLKATRLYAERDKNRKGRLRAMLNDAHGRGIKIESGSEYLRGLELEARQHGDLVEKIDVSGNINIRSDDELADRAEAIKRRGRELAAARLTAGA